MRKLKGFSLAGTSGHFILLEIEMFRIRNRIDESLRFGPCKP
jgi:hypothetical protein